MSDRALTVVLLAVPLLLIAGLVASLSTAWDRWQAMQNAFEREVLLRVVTPDPSPDALERTRRVVQERLKAYGARRSRVQVQTPPRLRVQASGLSEDNYRRFLRSVTQVSRLEFRLVKPGAKGLTVSELREARAANPKLGEKDLMPPSALEPAALTNADLERAEAVSDSDGTPRVRLTFTPEGGRKLERLTGANPGRRLAVVLDGKVYTAPRIGGPISGGVAAVSASSAAEAKGLADKLQAAAVPLRLAVENPKP
ncbi:protein-export membrane protein SecD [Calidithermus terrae]|uniref:Protein-export membrane protein SecD n=1 Tax=Calidithermus terrae TaxID=1408545 RepID=A0A399EXM1_9DEIN|nr:hypothetical protein [Calidithermus terrae]RIH88186.1 protein-export membrane protein SecD [Calidithermus terrae]